MSPYSDGEGPSSGNQYDLHSKYSEYKILMAEGQVYALVAKHFFEKIKRRMEVEDRRKQEANPGFSPPSDITGGLLRPQ